MNKFADLFCRFFAICIVTSQCIHAEVFDVVSHLESADAFSKFRAQDIPQGILYYHHDDEPDVFKSRTKNIIDGSESILKDYPVFMKFATVNCKSKGMEYMDACSGKGRRRFYAYKPNAEPERYSLRTFYDEEAFISQMIYFVYQSEISIIENKNDLENLQIAVKGKRDILFMYFQALGTKVHYVFMLYYLEHREKNTMEFAYTLDDQLALELGKERSSAGGLWFAKCSTVNVGSTHPCPYDSITETSTLDTALIHSLVSLQSMAPVSSMNEDGSTLYDGLKNVHVLYMFIENDEQLSMVTKMANIVIKKCNNMSVVLRVALADRRKQGLLLEREFGITADTMLPTAMLSVPPKIDDDEMEDKNLKLLEPFTPDEDFEVDSLFNFIQNLVFKMDQYYKSLEDVFYIRCIKSKDWKGIESIKNAMRDTLIGMCSSDADKQETCRSFFREFRRIVRTMYSGGLLNFDYLYIDESLKDEVEDFDDIPAVALVFQQKMFKFPNRINYEGLLQWINEQVKGNLPSLPLSALDLLHLPSHSRLNENQEIETDNGSNENLIAYQEDEVGMVAAKERNQKFYKDNTLKLTDETFEKTVNMTELLMVAFILPGSDDVSFFLQPIIASIDTEVSKESLSNMIPAKVAVVDCEMQYLVCRNDILMFPTIRFYSKGKILGVYNGMLDKKSVLNALRLYQQPALLEVSGESILKYRAPSMDNNGLSILGWFASENEDFQIYKKVANDYRGRMKFAYAMGESARKILPEMPESTLISAHVAGKLSRSFHGAIESFSKESLEEFLRIAPIPAFGELTMENFPAYKSLNKPMLVLFVPGNKKTESIAWDVILHAVKDKSLERYVFFTWMNTEKSVTKDIRRSYLGTRKEMEADIVIVNHTKGEVYHYNGPQDNVDVSAQELTMWINKCANGEVGPKSHLKVIPWKPLREGFDFLHLIDTDQISAGFSREEFEKAQALENGAIENSDMEDLKKEITTEKVLKFHGAKISRKFNAPIKTSPEDSVQKNEDEELDPAELADIDSNNDDLDEFSKLIDMSNGFDLNENDLTGNKKDEL